MQQTRRNALPRNLWSEKWFSIAINFAVLYQIELTYVDIRAKIALLPVGETFLLFSRRAPLRSRVPSGKPRSQNRTRSEFSCRTKLFLLVAVSLNHWIRYSRAIRGRRGTVGLLTGAGAPSENSVATENEKRGGGRASWCVSRSEPRLAELRLLSRCSTVPYIESWDSTSGEGTIC